MTRLYHPQWKRTNGEVGSEVFQDWCRELLPYGSSGVLSALQEVKNAGSAYLPPLVKFMSLARGGNSDFGHGGDLSYSETQHDGKLKPTPNGVPLIWTIGNYSYEELMASGHPKDAEKAISLK